MKIVSDISLTSARHRPMGVSVPWFTPWNSPTSGTVPGLVLDFSDGTYGAGGAVGPIGSTVSFSRASDGTRIDATGALDVVGPNIARIDYDPVTSTPIGLLLEAARTNLFLQSGAPADQSVTVAAVSHILSFYGTGSVTLGGAHTATLTGSGAFPARTELSFAPSAGTLTLTLLGDVQSLQLEEGAKASSYVPTLAAAAERADDIATVPLGSWFNAAEGTLVFEGSLESAQGNTRIFEFDAGISASRMSVLWNSVLGKPQFQVWDAGVLQAAIAPAGNAINLGDPFRVTIAYKANEFGVSLNGGTVTTDLSGGLPTGLSTLRLGRSISGAQGLMLAESVVYYPTRLSDAEVQALSA